MYTCFKRNDKREVKVAQLAGSVAEMSAYHHGEVSVKTGKDVCVIIPYFPTPLYWSIRMYLVKSTCQLNNSPRSGGKYL